MGKKQDIRLHDEWMATNGEHILLCVPCEVDTSTNFTTPAIAVADGMSLCRAHLEAWVRFHPPGYFNFQ